MQELRQKYPLNGLLHVAGLSRSSFYYLIKDKADKNVEIKVKIAEIYHEHKGRYGYRRITIELHNQGYLINHKKVQRLMGILGLASMVKIKKYKSYKGNIGKIAPNILERNFVATRPNQKWVTDITEFSLFGQKLYLSPILDLYNGEIISYSICNRPTLYLMKDMLEKARVIMQRNQGLIIHSDQGWHYQHKHYREFIGSLGAIQSMSRKGNCLDNSVMENFFGNLKSELLYLQKFNNIEHFVKELHEYIYYYNNIRIRTKLKMSPVQYRTHFVAA